MGRSEYEPKGVGGINAPVSDRLLRIQRDIGIALCSSSNLLTSLERLLETTLNIGVIDCSGIYLVDENTDEIYLVMQKNLSDEFIRRNSHYSSDSLQHEILEKGLPFYGACFDFTDNIPVDPFTNGLLGCGIIPITYGGKVVGSLNVASHSHDILPSEIQDSLEAIAVQIGGFIARIRSELNLEKRQKDLQNLFDSIEDLFFVIDLTGHIIDATKKTSERLGYTLDELRAIGLLGLHSENDRDVVMKAIREVGEKKHASFSLSFITKDGLSIPAEVKVTPGKWGGKDVYFGICRDISDREHAEYMLKKEKDKLQNYLDIIGVIIFVVDRDQNVISINRKGCRMFGLSESDIIGKKWYDLGFSEEFSFQGRKAFPKLMGGDMNIMEYSESSIVTDAGDARIIAWHTVVLRSVEGVITGLLCSGEDVTEFRNAEAALKSSEEKYRVVFNGSLDGITIHERDNYRLLDINDRGCEMSGYSREEVLGRTAEDIKGGKALYSLEKIMWLIDSASENGFVSAEWKARKKNGELFWTEVMARSAMIGGKECIIITIQDLTERKNAEKALMEIEAMRKKEIHHRIKNNLQIICSLLDLCSMEFEDTSVVQAFMESRARVMSMSLIHEELYQSTDMESINFADYIQKLAAELISSYSLDKDIELELNVEDIFLSMDTAIPLGIIINELVTNSLKHAFQGMPGKISIDLKHGDENRFILIVTDNGIGFPEEIDYKNSTSLGLQLLKTLVDQIGGTIVMDRTSGTAFTIIFNENSRI
ncbi:PAS domain S-box protein [Methanococcoides sp. NM1]|uniref:PAS domain S-box protein n=1 Tax=Methanococcoides sp. NM1 TaxID=1201013 RepID=UPI0010834912|nr:PAS domain S-box protein [Methanococcoides sp. NM1]